MPLNNDNEFLKLIVARGMQQQALSFIQRLLTNAQVDYNAALQSMLFQDSGRDGALVKYGIYKAYENLQFEMRRYFDKNK